MIVYLDGAENPTVACDEAGCSEYVDPGEWDGPFTSQVAALRAAEGRGWAVSRDTDLCPQHAEEHATRDAEAVA